MKSLLLLTALLTALLYSGHSETIASRCHGPSPEACQRF